MEISKEKNFISAVVYVRNSENTIEKFLQTINDILQKKFINYEIIIVNDDSTDNTIAKIKDFGKKNTSSLSIINMSYTQGKELAINAGSDMAIGDFVYEFDTTNIDYDEEIIIQAYEKSITDESDVVIVSSKKKRKFTSALFYKIFNKYSNYQYKINTETFKILSRRGINRIRSINKTIPYRKAVIANCGLKVTTLLYDSNIKISKNCDKKEKSERKKNAIDALILFTDASYKVTTKIIATMIAITMLVIIYIVYTFLKHNPIQGWTTIMLFLCFGFLGLFTLLAIIIKYLSVIVGLIFKKTNYLIKSIDKIK